MQDPVPPPRLVAHDISKRFGHVQALHAASFSVDAGEIVALVGDNGAGKSTLVKVLSGVLPPDSGRIEIDGRPVTFHGPADARRLGIETVYQDLALAFDLDAAANLHLGREIMRRGPLGYAGVLDRATMQRRTATALDELGIQLPSVAVPVRSLSGGQRQCVAVARAAAWATRVVFLDEPTAALGVVQREQVLDMMRRVRDRGLAVVLISHNMPEVLAVADRIEVLRLGQRVARFTAAETSIEELVSAMTGGLTTEGRAA